MSNTESAVLIRISRTTSGFAAPFVSIAVPESVKTLAELREVLLKTRYMNSTDAFVARSRFPIHKEDEVNVKLENFYDAAGSGQDPLYQDPSPTTFASITIISRAFDLAPYASSTPSALMATVEEGRHEEGRTTLSVLEAGRTSAANAKGLSKAQLDELFDINNIFGGTSFTGPPGGTEQVFQPPKELMRYIWAYDGSQYEVFKTSYAKEASMAKEGVHTASLGGTTAWLEFGASASYTSRSSWETSESYTYVVGTYRFPRALIRLPVSEMRPTLKFKNELVAALAYSANPDLQRIRLLDFFSKYGHAFASEVQLGGHLHTSLTVKKETSNGAESAETAIQVGLSSPFGVKADMGYKGSESSTKSSSQEQSKLVVEAIGGDTLLSSLPMRWATTVMPYSNWRITKRTSMQLIIDIHALVSGSQRVDIVKILGTKPGQPMVPVK